MKTKLNVKKKIPMKIRHPYVRNTISFHSELYPSDGSQKPVMRATSSGSFSVRLLPLLVGTFSGFAVLYLALMRKIRK